MEKKFKLGVIGAGFMSGAIVNGAISSKYIAAADIIVSDINQSALERMKEKGVSVTTDNAVLLQNSEYVLFAIKPQTFESVAAYLKSDVHFKFISIMAGVKKSKIKNFFPNAEVVRCMPNTPCSVGYGAVGIDLSDYKEETDVLFVKKLFSAFAETVFVEEDKLNAVTGISGSSPAYFYLFLKGIIDAGVKHGLSESDAKKLACNTMIGSGIMVLNNKEKTLEELIDAVCSKGGTTIEAIKIYKESGLGDITENAVNACVNRASELENL